MSISSSSTSWTDSPSRVSKGARGGNGNRVRNTCRGHETRILIHDLSLITPLLARCCLYRARLTRVDQEIEYRILVLVTSSTIFLSLTLSSPHI